MYAGGDDVATVDAGVVGVDGRSRGMGWDALMKCGSYIFSGVVGRLGEGVVVCAGVLRYRSMFVGGCLLAVWWAFAQDEEGGFAVVVVVVVVVCGRGSGM